MMLSFTRPSPVTFTEKGLPAGREHSPCPTQVTFLPAGCGAWQGGWPRHGGQRVHAPLTRHVLVSELDVDDVVSGLCGAVGDPARAILQVLCVDVHLAGALDGQAKSAVAWKATALSQGAEPGGPPPSW